MAQIVLTLFDFNEASNRSNKITIDPDFIAYTSPKTFDEGKATYVCIKNLSSHLHVVETPEEIAELIAASASVPTPSKFIKLHAVQKGYISPICLNMDKIEKFYPEDNLTFNDELPDSLSPENVDKARLTVVHYKTGSSSNYYEFLESYDYICKMLSAR